MKIKKLNNYHTDENTYLVYDEVTKNAVVIDPGYTCEGILKSASDDSLTICAILITHCHYDHIACMEELREKTGAILVCGKKCSINIQDPAINLSFSGLGRDISAKPAERVLQNNEIYQLDSLSFQCLETPGHTNCGVCYFILDHVFVGDTLFLRNVGRWDLPTGDEMRLRNSIQTVLYQLPDDTIVCCGHGDATTIGYEKKFNFYVKDEAE